MYRGFNLTIDRQLNDHFYSKGEEALKKNKQIVETKLEEFLLDDGSLDGTKIIENWFPTIKADIFLSHSHKDEKLAIIIAGILKVKLNLDTFIDSTIWGYSEKLLEIIDKKYCLNPGSKTYNYKKRNFSTSHVNLMLSSALNKMIDNSECILFLNSPNSVSMENLDEFTYSPWIFSEISTTQIIRKNIPERLKSIIKTKEFSEIIAMERASEPKLAIKYKLDLSHLAKIDRKEFVKWVEEKFENKHLALNKLYEIKPAPKKQI